MPVRALLVLVALTLTVLGWACIDYGHDAWLSVPRPETHCPGAGRTALRGWLLLGAAPLLELSAAAIGVRLLRPSAGSGVPATVVATVTALLAAGLLFASGWALLHDATGPRPHTSCGTP